MNRRKYILPLILSQTAVMPVCAKTNILIIYTDEHNFRTIESYVSLLGEGQQNIWGEVPLSTPNLNYLAANGILFNNCYVTTPVSTPSRASLMTGMYPQKTNCITNDLPLDQSIKTIAQVFQENGYRTGYIGKWHLSGKAKPGWKPSFNYGWQNNEYMFNRGHYKSIKEGVNHPEVLVPAPNQESDYQFMTPFLTDKANAFINETSESPFLCMLSIPDPHGPNVVTEPYYTIYQNYTFQKPYTARKKLDSYPSWAKGTAALRQNALRNYWGMVKCIDDNVGRILENLRKNNKLENTIIVFTSDHGDMCGEHGRENKSVPLEASMKVPLIICIPDFQHKGRVIQEAISNIDLFPTLAHLCGLSNIPSVDGRNLTPLLYEDESYKEVNCVYSRSTGLDSGWLAVTTDQYKLVYSSDADDKPWLFDKQKDPDELINYYAYPEYQTVRKMLQDSLLKYCKYHQEPKFQNSKIRSELEQQ